MIGLLAGLFGAALGFAAVQLLVSGGAHLTTGRAVTTLIAGIVLGILGAGAARLGVTASVLNRDVAASRRSTVRQRKPAWKRYYLDFAALAGSGLVYWLTARTGFSAVVNPDSNPTLSLSVYMFFAPALLWIGATLLLVRLRGRALAWLAKRASTRQPGSMRSLLMASAGRRGAAINRGLVVVGLLLAFGVSLGIFSATYNQQAQVDAQLTLGADVTASSPPGVAASKDLAAKVAAVPGVAATTPVDHSYAYVGPDLQDTYGINPSSFTNATSLRDSYFVGRRRQPEHEQAGSDQGRDPRLQGDDHRLLAEAGDLLRLRVLDQRTGQFHVVPSTSSAPCRSSRRRRATRSWSPTCPTCRRRTAPRARMRSSPRPVAPRRPPWVRAWQPPPRPSAYRSRTSTSRRLAPPARSQRWT